MPRNSGGDYSLPAGNPVVAGTPITIAWANGTLNDLAAAMTDSLSRSGDGGMLAPLELAAGAVGAPGLAFSAETTLGLYRAAAGELAVAVGGSKIAAFTSTGLAITGALSVSGAITLSSTLNVVGDFSVATNKFNVTAASGNTSIAGTLAVTGVSTFSANLRAANEAAGDPSYSFTNDTDTGMFLNGVGTLGFSVGGTQRLSLTTTALTSTVAFVAPSVNIASGGAIAALVSGTYSPTDSANSNLDSCTPGLHFYMRIGDIVVVWGSASVNVTTGGSNASFEINLPVASNIGATTDVEGCGSFDAIGVGEGGGIIVDGVVANDTARVVFLTSDTGAAGVHYTFAYRVL